MPNEIKEFSGGDSGLRTHLNEVVRAINWLLKLTGDNFIKVNKGTSFQLQLNINEVASRIPRLRGGEGGSPAVVTYVTITQTLSIEDEDDVAAYTAQFDDSNISPVTINHILEEVEESGGVDMRLYSPWYPDGARIPVVQRDGYWCFDRTMTKIGTGGSLSWNVVDGVLEAVWG